MSKTNYEGNRALDARYGDGTYTKPATVYIGLFLAMPTPSTSGTEVSAGGYARVALTNDATTFPDAVNRLKTVGVVVTFPQATAPGYGSTVGFGFWDAPTGGNLQDYAQYTGGVPKVVGTGDVPSFPIGSLTFAEN
ncbi:MAG: hypothetical protein ABW208_07120 [Pyrinomonadaceae bacterium]